MLRVLADRAETGPTIRGWSSTPPTSCLPGGVRDGERGRPRAPRALGRGPPGAVPAQPAGVYPAYYGALRPAASRCRSTPTRADPCWRTWSSPAPRCGRSSRGRTFWISSRSWTRWVPSTWWSSPATASGRTSSHGAEAIGWDEWLAGPPADAAGRGLPRPRRDRPDPVHLGHVRAAAEGRGVPAPLPLPVLGRRGRLPGPHGGRRALDAAAVLARARRSTSSRTPPCTWVPPPTSRAASPRASYWEQLRRRRRHVRDHVRADGARWSMKLPREQAPPHKVPPALLRPAAPERVAFEERFAPSSSSGRATA